MSSRISSIQLHCSGSSSISKTKIIVFFSLYFKLKYLKFNLIFKCNSKYKHRSANTATSKRIANREKQTGVCRHHGGKFRDTLKPLVPSDHFYFIERFKGILLNSSYHQSTFILLRGLRGALY